MLPRALVQYKLGDLLIKATQQQRPHHEYLLNIGLYFRFWDRLCGTDRGLSSRWAA
jgi:sterol desaturase/sphingolipid hydroxylase (fatty acid hydroxylase superfamily)